MKSIVYSCIIVFSSVFFFSCSDDDIMLYHPEEEPSTPSKTRLLQKVDYPEGGLQLADRQDLTFSYTAGLLVKQITNLQLEVLNVDYKEGWVFYSRIRQSSTENNIYDSIQVKLDKNKRAMYALHGTYIEYIDEDGNPKIEPGQVDSTAFIYDAEGYLKQLKRYSSSTSEVPTYTETRTIQNGNITEIMTSSMYKYTFTYDNQEHSIPAGFCYEMPGNTHSLIKGGCWTLANMAFLSDYLGKRSSNNVINAVITRNYEIGYVDYANISYTYTFDENELVTQVKMTGIVGETQIPDNYITTFSYIESEK
jgi:hypothetical protein